MVLNAVQRSLLDVQALDTALKQEFRASGVIVPPPPVLTAGRLLLPNTEDGMDV